MLGFVIVTDENLINGHSKMKRCFCFNGVNTPLEILLMIFSILFTFTITAVMAEGIISQSKKYSVNLESPESTFRTCYLWNKHKLPKKHVVHHFENCLTTNAQKELVIYFYIGSLLLAGMHESDYASKSLDRIVKRYNLDETFDKLLKEEKDETLIQIDTVNLLYDLYKYLSTYSNPVKAKSIKLKNVQIAKDKASGLEVSKDKTIWKSDRLVLFIKIENNWLIDGWKERQ